MDVYYFGCLKQAGYGFEQLGHFLYKKPSEDSPVYGVDDTGAAPWGLLTLDGHLAPRTIDNDEAPQGEALLHHDSGWTAVSFWDRSGDPSEGSSSAFLIPETLDFYETMNVANTAWRRLMARFGFEVVLHGAELPGNYRRAHPPLPEGSAAMPADPYDEAGAPEDPHTKSDKRVRVCDLEVGDDFTLEDVNYVITRKGDDCIKGRGETEEVVSVIRFYNPLRPRPEHTVDWYTTVEVSEEDPEVTDAENRHDQRPQALVRESSEELG